MEKGVLWVQKGFTEMTVTIQRQVTKALQVEC